MQRIVWFDVQECTTRTLSDTLVACHQPTVLQQGAADEYLDEADTLTDATGSSAASADDRHWE